MTTAIADSAAARPPRLFRHAVGIALAAAVAALILLAIGPIGWRIGWWDYGFAFTRLMPAAFDCGIGAAALSLIALAFGRIQFGRRHFAIGLAALVIGAATAAVPWHYSQMRGKYPPIDDITTDMQNPPQFVAAVALRAAERGNSPAYGGAAIAAQQQKAYPDILPLTLALDPVQVFGRALKTAIGMGWTITGNDPASGRIEAYDRSRWFGFTDDIAIRVTPSDGGSRVDIRSASRHGRGDFGVNAERIRAYLAALRQGGEVR
jgi:uncharacterized protein (DUF1499 family)